MTCTSLQKGAKVTRTKLAADDMERLRTESDIKIENQTGENKRHNFLRNK